MESSNRIDQVMRYVLSEMTEREKLEMEAQMASDPGLAELVRSTLDADGWLLEHSAPNEPAARIASLGRLVPWMLPLAAGLVMLMLVVDWPTEVESRYRVALLEKSSETLGQARGAGGIEDRGGSEEHREQLAAADAMAAREALDRRHHELVAQTTFFVPIELSVECSVLILAFAPGQEVKRLFPDDLLTDQRAVDASRLPAGLQILPAPRSSGVRGFPRYGTMPTMQALVLVQAEPFSEGLFEHLETWANGAPPASLDETMRRLLEISSDSAEIQVLTVRGE